MNLLNLVKEATQGTKKFIKQCEQTSPGVGGIVKKDYNVKA